MKRHLLSKLQNGNRTSHGTALYLDALDCFVTSHPLDESLGEEYFITFKDSDGKVAKIVSAEELYLPADGVPVSSLPPYVYRLTILSIDG